MKNAKDNKMSNEIIVIDMRPEGSLVIFQRWHPTPLPGRPNDTYRFGYRCKEVIGEYTGFESIDAAFKHYNSVIIAVKPTIAENKIIAMRPSVIHVDFIAKKRL